MYKERLGDEFSTQKFEALRAEACTVGSEAPGIMKVWNAAWVQSQEVSQWLEEMQKKKRGVDKSQIQQTTAANPPGEHGGIEREVKRSEVGEVVSSLALQSVCSAEAVSATENTGESTAAACKDSFNTDIKGSKKQDSNMLQFPETSVTSATGNPISPQIHDFYRENKWRPREHHSEADLRSASSAKDTKSFPVRQTLGRSLSEGSCVKSTSSFSALNTSRKHCHSRSLDQNLQPIQKLHILHRPQNLSCQSGRNSNKGERDGCTVFAQSPEDSKTPETLTTPTENNGSNIL